MKNPRACLPKWCWPKWRWIALVLAIAAVAFILWQLDGAWEYGAMPTKGLFRTIMFASGAVVCLLIPKVLSRLDDPD